METAVFDTEQRRLRPGVLTRKDTRLAARMALFKLVDVSDGMRLALVDDAHAFNLEGAFLGLLSKQPGFDGTEPYEALHYGLRPLPVVAIELT